MTDKVGNIDKRAGVEVEGVAYRFVQTRQGLSKPSSGGTLQIHKRIKTGAYVYFGEAGQQHVIETLPLDERREILRTRVMEILSEQK